MSRIAPFLLAATIIAAPAAAFAEVSVTLKGSRASMIRQNRIAKEEAYSFLRTPSQVRSFVDNGQLVELEGNSDYDVIAGYPFARPVVRAFVERLGARYREACGDKLVVTSLTRPATRQPRNASALSVHPAGMAVDLRVSPYAACRDWLSTELLALEDMGVIDATREYRPPHFHVAVFPAPFSEYDAELAAAEAERLAIEVAARNAELATALLQIRTPPPPASMLRMMASFIVLLFLPIPV